MDINLAFYNTFDERDYFELTEGKRPWHVFLIIKKGSFEYEIDGKTNRVNENEIAFFPADKYFFRRIITPISFHQLAFILPKDETSITSINHGVLPIPKTHVLTIIETLDKIKGFSVKSELYKHQIKSIIYESKIYSKDEFETEKKLPKDVLTAINFMSENLDKKISIPSLAKMVNLTNVGFIWKFKKYVGVSPSDFLIGLKMKLAKKLLVDNTLSVKEIAELCGYENPSYFSNAFKSYYGTRPTKFTDNL